MASYINDLQRNMLPLWRNYEDTANARELEFDGQKVLPARFERFNSFRDTWRAKHSIINAADLVNAAVVSDKKQGLDVLDAAEYMLNHSEECSPLALDVARSIVEFPKSGIDIGMEKPLSFEMQAEELIHRLKSQEEGIKARIGLLRKQVHSHCFNPIAYCELARCYANLGMDEKAKKYMNYAVYLAPQSRYIARCAARFYVHINDFDRAKRILLDSGRVNIDPWVMSAEIAVESLMGRSSRYIKTGRKLVMSGNVSPFSSSELCFAICNEDRESGARKDARIMYEKGIVDPNDNSLAQAIFFAKEDTNINLDISSFNRVVHKHEAEMRKAIRLGDYQEAFIYSLKWMQDYRFEHRPIEFAFGLSCDYLKNYDYAIDIVERFLEFNPTDLAAINNKLYALGLSDKVEEAEIYINQVDIRRYLKDNISNGICLIATYGLLQYRKGNIEEGRELYNKAIEAAKKQNYKNLADKARLNMIREEVHCVDEYDPAILTEMESLNTGDLIETEQLKADIRTELQKREERKAKESPYTA